MVAALLCHPTRGSAQVVPGPTDPPLVPPVPFADPGDALALEIQPAALAFERTWHLRYLHAEPPSDVDGAARSDAVLASVKLPFGLALGAGITSLRPQGGGASRGRGSLALAWAPSDALAFGTALRVIRTDDPAIGDLSTLDLSVGWRPSPLLALALDVTDVTGPAGLTELRSGDLPAGFRLAVGLRPFGDGALVVDLSGRVTTDGAVAARAAIDVALPRFGRLRAAADATGLDGGDAAVAILAGLAVDWGGLRAEGGAIVGDVRSTSATGWYASALLSGARRGGLPIRRVLLDLPLRGGLGDPHQLPEVLAYLERLRDVPDLGGVLLRLRNTGLGVATAGELGEEIDALRDAGVPVVCHLEAPSGSEWLACLRAGAIVVDPAGGVRLTGPSTTVILVGELLDRLGVRADFLRIGRYKSAPEQFSNARPSPPAMDARRAFLDDVQEHLGARIAEGMGVDADRAQEIVAGGPYTAPEALEGNLIRGLADDGALERPLREILGERLPRVRSLPASSPTRWSRPTRIGVVVVDGQMVDGRNVDVPILDIHLSGGDTIVEAIDGFARDPAIAAIVLRVDSPGGSALAADRIWRAVRRARRRKPVVASLGAVAASGGYYIASAADVVFADAATLTGSIGIFFGKVDVAGLAEKLGVFTTQLQGAPRAGYQSLFRPFSPDERAMLADKIRLYYRRFLDRVAAGRGMEVTAVDAVARGRIWSGRAALDRGLVDELGGFGRALRDARRRAGLEGRTDVGVLVRPGRPRELLDYVIGDMVQAGTDGSEAGGDVAGGAPPAAEPSGADVGAVLGAVDPGLVPLLGRAAGLARVAPDIPLALLPEVISAPPR